MAAGKIRDRGEVLGFGAAAVLFLPGVAYLGITNGHQFIANDFFAFMYCLASVGFASVPLLAWRRGGGRYAGPGFVRYAWFPWLFTTMQGVAYSAPRGDANAFMLIFGWGMFIYAGMAALYFLARALWSTDDETGAEAGDFRGLVLGVSRAVRLRRHVGHRRQHRAPQRTATGRGNPRTPPTDRLPGLPRPARDPPAEVLANLGQLTSATSRSPTESS
ncbi:hypothetical protein EES42_30755 [Streptomyces sp. ADI95-17]|nr:hypothetical protein EES42_30755 [Streptomyces sp. ADI95-17]